MNDTVDKSYQKIIFITIISSFGLGACNLKPNNEKPTAEYENTHTPCGLKASNKTIKLIRQNKAPQKITTKLPVSSNYCFVIHSDASSAEVMLDENRIIGPDRFKNREQTFEHVESDLSMKSHELGLEIRGKSGSFIEVDVYYGTQGNYQEPGIEDEQEAALLGHRWISKRSQEIGSINHWDDVVIGKITKAYDQNGNVNAYVLDLEDQEGNDAGGLVLEKNATRPLLGSATPTAPSFTKALDELYQEQFGEPLELPGNSVRYSWEWAGFGLLVATVTLPSGEVREISECPQCLDNIDDIEHWMLETSDETKAFRGAIEQQLLDEVDMQQRQSTLCDDGDVENNNDCDNLEGFPNSKHITCSYDGYKAPRGVSCEKPAFPDYYQYTGDWPDHDADGDSIGENTCFTGCVPVAFAQLLGFWKRQGYEYIAPAGEHDGTSDTIEKELGELRKALETRCKEDGQGGTYPKNYHNIIDYINSTPGIASDIHFSSDLGWRFSSTTATDEAETVVVFDKMKKSINNNTPPMMSYLSSWRKYRKDLESLAEENSEDPSESEIEEMLNEKGTTHVVVVYGYYDDPNGNEDVYIVRTGWEKVKTRIEPLRGTGVITLRELTPPGCAQLTEPYCKTYPDLPSNHWGYTPVQALTCDCVLEGYKGGEKAGYFGTNDPMTKAEFIKVVMKLAFPYDSFEQTEVKNIKDVDKDHWGSGYIQAADELGILEYLKTEDGSLWPNLYIKRDEAAYLISEVSHKTTQGNFVKLAGMFKCGNLYDDQGVFADIDETNPAWSGAVAGAKLCIWEGYEGNQFKPDGLLTRVEASKVACMARYGYGSDLCGNSNSNCVVQTCDK